MAEEQFDVESFLTTTEFTIPVVVSEKKGQNKTIQVTYDFSDEIAEKFKEKPATNGNGDEGDDTAKVMITLNKQLSLMIKKINGVEVPIDEIFWSRTRLKYRKTILKAVLEDVYPNEKTSMA